MKKILFLNQTFGMGGAEQFGADLLRNFQDQGIEVTCYVTHLPFAELLTQRGLREVHLITTKLDIIGNWKGLLKAVFLFPWAWFEYRSILKKHDNAEVVLLSGFLEKCLVSGLAQQRRLPVVWIEYGPLETVFKKFWRLPYFLYQRVIAIPQLVIVPTHNTAKHLLASLPKLAKKITVIPCGRPLPVLKKTIIKPQQVVCVSRMEQGKGQDLLVAAFAQVVQQVPEAQLVLVGEGSFMKTVKQIVAEYHLEKSITFLGLVDDALQVMRESAVCVFPSVWELEGFGLVTIEAMSLGKPVVAFKTGPTPEIIDDGKTGLLVEKGDVTALASSIATLLQNPSLATKLGTKAQAVFREKYQIERLGIQYVSAIKAIL